MSGNTDGSSRGGMDGEMNKIQVQSASKERINRNPPAFGGTDVVEEVRLPAAFCSSLPAAKPRLCSSGEVDFTGSISFHGDWTQEVHRGAQTHT